jgi:NADH:ubiquinone oxidoreductase subunit 6 (subunit J)
LLLVTIFCGFILFLLNFEFLAIILLLVYIGGIGVLFLFAIILLNFKRFQVKLI